MTNLSWQKALLPFMQFIIVGLTAFYLVASYVQFSYFAERIEKPPAADLSDFTSTISLQALSRDSLSLQEKQWLTKSFFEAYVVESKQRNTEFLMISRTWIKYLGFVTGVILAIVGAVFILGKLKDEMGNTLNAEQSSFKLSFSSHSPGLVMALLGTVLIIGTIFTHQPIERTDAAIYLSRDPAVIGVTSEEQMQNLLKMLMKDSSVANQSPNPDQTPPNGF